MKLSTVPINFYSVEIIALVLSGMATALFSKENIRNTLKNLGGGLCAGAVVAIILYAFEVTRGTTLLFSCLMSGFATKFWTETGDLLIRLAIGWIRYKINQYPIQEPPKLDKNGD